jgi:AcrR family transcriptional regulator
MSTLLTEVGVGARVTYRHGDLPDALGAAAMRLVRELGVPSFSLRQAARDVGVDVAAIYRHYADKEDLLRSVARAGFVALGEAMAEEREAASGAEDRFRAVGMAYIRFAVREPQLFRLMFGPVGAGGVTPLFEGGVSPASAALYEGLQELQSVGACAWPAADAATAAWATVHGLATLLVDGPIPHVEAEQRAKVVLDICLSGLRDVAHGQGVGR